MLGNVLVLMALVHVRLQRKLIPDLKQMQQYRNPHEIIKSCSLTKFTLMKLLKASSKFKQQ